MRQAGRYLPEYRRIRERFSFLDLCRDSATAAEVTVGAVATLGVDAAIVFADILLPLVDSGLTYENGDGPRIARPVRRIEDIESLKGLNVEDALGFVAKTILLTRRELGKTVPVIGFAGAPFTVAAYAVEGGASRNYVATKSLMYNEPVIWHELMESVVRITIDYLNMQIDAGADAVQLFDSWVGALSPEDYRKYVQPYSAKVIESLRSGTPVIHFGTMSGSLLTDMREAGGDVIGLDWRVNLDEAWARLGTDVAVQGNLDPTLLFSDRRTIRQAVTATLRRAAGRPGHIFNLGHGILPQTPLDNVRALVDAVHEMSTAGC